jgi:hypothetical protein
MKHPPIWHSAIAQGRMWVWRISILLLALALAACDNSNATGGDPSGQNSQNSAPRTRADTVEHIFSNPQALYNQGTMVSAFITAAPGANMFVLRDSADSAGKELLVVNTIAQQAPVRPEDVNKPVMVMGTLEKFNLKEIEARYTLDLDDAAAQAFADQPVLIATTITSAEGGPTGVGTATPQP